MDHLSCLNLVGFKQPENAELGKLKVHSVNGLSAGGNVLIGAILSFTDIELGSNGHIQ